MARKRYNFISGTLSALLSSTGTTMSSAALADLPAVASGDYVAIVLDPEGTAGDPEIAYITAHTASATTATLASTSGNRAAKEGTSAREHADTIPWIHAPTKADYDSVDTIDLPKIDTDEIDDDFDETTLNARWTVVGGRGTTGTVSLTAASSAGIYDLTTDPGTLLVQVDNNQVSLRQTNSLSNGESLIGCFAMTALSDSATGWAASEQSIRMGLTSGSSTIGDGSGVRMEVATDDERLSLRYRTVSGTINYGPPEPGLVLLSDRFYFRIHRSGTSYYGFYSANGDLWVPMGSHTVATTLSYIWIDFYSGADAGTPVPMLACHWIRIGSSGLRPW